MVCFVSPAFAGTTHDWLELRWHGSTPFIDFSRNPGDFDARIILWNNHTLRFEGANLFVHNNQKVGIGVENPTHKLEVNGVIKAKEIIVETAGFPDYVFLDDYSLMPLEEVETFIQTNGHLPNIPKGESIEQSGIELGEMQRLMVEKIEEITLHMIEQKKRIDALEAENEQLRLALEK